MSKIIKENPKQSKGEIETRKSLAEGHGITFPNAKEAIEWLKGNLSEDEIKKKMKKVPLRKISPKQQEKQILWNKITEESAEILGYICEWCGKKGHRDKGRHEDWYYLDGHHKVKRSKGRVDTPENCYLTHRTCHGEVEENNVDVNIFKNKLEWESREDKR